MTKRVMVDRASVGTLPKRHLTRTVQRPDDRVIETLKFAVDDFRNNEDEIVHSSFLNAHGFKWQMYVRLLTGIRAGRIELGADGIEFGLKLAHRCNAIHATLATSSTVQFRCKSEKQVRRMGAYSIYRIREEAEKVDQLIEEDGRLAFEADIDMKSAVRRFWYPTEIQQSPVLVRLYQDDTYKTADVAFSVGGNIYRAHKNILSVQCKELYEISNEANGGSGEKNPTPISMDSTVRSEIFEMLLEFLYTIKAPQIETEETAIDLLIAADRFGCIDLKLWVESVLVERFLNTERAAALLILADSRSCALLKEAAMNLILDDPETAKDSQEDWSEVEESKRLREELLAHKIQDENSVHRLKVDKANLPLEEIEDEKSADRCETVDDMDVTALRWELEQADLEVDGSREVLVERLKSHENCKGPINRVSRII
mmetsp:Transcript_2790/g.7668  ORF Transcript_2790/g.7668 Transcript_2790/m.7668 type:complete len:429 (-) Transcript_2790:2299-3585(-)